MTHTTQILTRFERAYIEAMLWSSLGDDDEPLDKNYSMTDLAPETVERIHADCEAFIAQCDDELDGDYEQAGHDFWLTRNHHGAGFWDGDWGKERGDRLTVASHSFGELWPYIGDDGMIYLG
jgi:hypothetical protein